MGGGSSSLDALLPLRDFAAVRPPRPSASAPRSILAAELPSFGGGGTGTASVLLDAAADDDALLDPEAKKQKAEQKLFKRLMEKQADQRLALTRWFRLDRGSEPGCPALFNLFPYLVLASEAFHGPCPQVGRGGAIR